MICESFTLLFYYNIYYQFMQNFHGYFPREFCCISPLEFFQGCQLTRGPGFQNSDKIIIPKSSLEPLISRPARDNLYVLRLMNPMNSNCTFVGIADFIAPEGSILVPDSIMCDLECKVGDRLLVNTLSVPPAEYAKIVLPKELMRLAEENCVINLLAVIEFSLKNHTLLFVKKQVLIKIFEKSWYIEVKELRPSSVCSILNTDLKVDIEAK